MLLLRSIKYVIYVMVIILVMYSCAHALCCLCHGNYTCYAQLCTCLMLFMSW